MWIPNNKTKRFTLYHLEENQMYIRDFSGFCTYQDIATGQTRTRDKGKFYICSKAIVFESEITSIPLIKFKYQQMKAEPKLVSEKKSDYAVKSNPETITFAISRVTTIKVSSNNPPEPFKQHDEYNGSIIIEPTYQEASKITDWIHQLYAQSKKKNVYDLEDKIYDWIKQKQNKKNFNMSLIESVSQKPLHEETNIFVRRILPLNHLYGYFFITDQRIYFQPFHSISGEAVIKIDVQDITRLFKRRFELREIGLEIITAKNSYYFTFDNSSHRDRLYTALAKKVTADCIKEEFLEKITYLWQSKQITNFDYLMHLNESGNRSLSDLSQYPVFPWVISQYTEQEIDLQNQSNYRDLTKPIGALNQERLQSFLERFEDMPPPKFMYGSHYSAPGYVIGYLLRKKPQFMLKLQSGRFDKPDRLFKSIKGDWKNVMNNPTSLKELIPEFYQSDPSFIVNKLGLDLGVRQNKKRVDDVKLPKWAKGSPELYLETNRKALESEYVSSNLHHWIDLIFGYKQRGQQAIKANNLFNYMTYQGMIDVQSIKDPIEKMSVKCQINEFGQCPKQIFKIPHPSRNSLTTAVPPAPSNQVEIPEHVEQDRPSDMVPNQASSLYSSTGRPKVKTAMAMGKPSDIKITDIPRAHKSAITKIIPLSGKANNVVTIGQDGFLKVYNVLEKNCLKSFKICDYCLSAIVPIKGDQLFALGSWDNNLYLFNIVFGSRSQPYAAHDNSISDLVYLQKKKRLVSSSWDCSIKMFRVTGNNFDNEQVFYDHDNQISNLAASPDQQALALGDIQGNVIVLNINQRHKLYELNLINQKVIRLEYMTTNLVAIGDSQIRLLDTNGTQITNFIIQKSNGRITDGKLDGEHLFVVTNKKHLGLYDLLQEKKLGTCFNDFRTSQEDKLQGQKELTCISVLSESTLLVVGSSNGNLYTLRS